MADKFLGCPYPIVKTPRGLLNTQSGVNQIKSDLLSLIMTNQNERIMLPDFGVNLRRFIFEPNDGQLVEEIRNQIIQQINLWEPRITIDQLEIRIPTEEDLPNEDELENILLIRIMFFDPENIKEVQELKLEVPISGEQFNDQSLGSTITI